MNKVRSALKIYGSIPRNPKGPMKVTCCYYTDCSRGLLAQAIRNNSTVWQMKRIWVFALLSAKQMSSAISVAPAGASPKMPTSSRVSFCPGAPIFSYALVFLFFLFLIIFLLLLLLPLLLFSQLVINGTKAYFYDHNVFLQDWQPSNKLFFFLLCFGKDFLT